MVFLLVSVTLVYAVGYRDHCHDCFSCDIVLRLYLLNCSSSEIFNLALSFGIIVVVCLAYLGLTCNFLYRAEIFIKEMVCDTNICF